MASFSRVFHVPAQGSGDDISEKSVVKPRSSQIPRPVYRKHVVRPKSPRPKSPRPKSPRPRTPSLYLSQKIPPVPSLSPPQIKERSVRRQPAVIETFVSEQREGAYTGQVLSKSWGPAEPITPHSNAYSFTAPTRLSRDGCYGTTLPLPHTGHSQQSPTKDTHLDGFRGPMMSPGMLSETSTTPSLCYSGSPFSHATTLTSRTSYSPLYTAKSSHVSGSTSEVFSSVSRPSKDLGTREILTSPPELAHLTDDYKIPFRQPVNTGSDERGSTDLQISRSDLGESVSRNMEDIVDEILSTTNKSVEMHSRTRQPLEAITTQTNNPPTLQRQELRIPMSIGSSSRSRSSFEFWKRDKPSAKERERTISLGLSRQKTSCTNSGKTSSHTDRTSSTRQHDRAPVNKTDTVDEFFANRLEPVYLRSGVEDPAKDRAGPILVSRTSISQTSENRSNSPSQQKRPPTPKLSFPQKRSMNMKATTTAPARASLGRPLSRSKSRHDNATDLLRALPHQPKSRSGLQRQQSSGLENPKRKSVVQQTQPQQTATDQKPIKKHNIFKRALLLASGKFRKAPVPNNGSSGGTHPGPELQNPHHISAASDATQGSSKPPHSDLTGKKPVEPVRRSASFIRTSLDAISRGRQPTHQAQTSRNGKSTRDNLSNDTGVHGPDCSRKDADGRATLVSANRCPEGLQMDVRDGQVQAWSSRGSLDIPVVINESDMLHDTTPNYGLWPTNANPTMPSTSANRAESKSHLSKVVEEEFILFTAQRDSASSNGSSSRTLCFPVAPTSPPTISLPRTPQPADDITPEIANAARPGVQKRAISDQRKPLQVQSSSMANSGQRRGDQLAYNRPAIESNLQRHEACTYPASQANVNVDQTFKAISNSNADARLQRHSTSGILSGRWDATTRAFNGDIVSMTDLRFASLMTSKWLSFGKILFSPIHTELNTHSNARVLVIDGLGTGKLNASSRMLTADIDADWSYYCSSNYPNIMVHTLTLGPSKSGLTGTINGLQAPPNHREDVCSELISRFPYSDNTFAATVVRFPVATTEGVLRLLISECTRVLRPGGYMEISAIDLDLLRMGSHARKAVRELKMGIHTRSPATCLKPASDSIQQLLGHCGYEKLSRCIIGVPAAASMASSGRASLEDHVPNFEDFMKDDSERSDKNITRMMSKVGRWWYNQCYESGNGGGSIWNDKVLLQECEDLHTAFKLFVCYAQKPVSLKEQA